MALASLFKLWPTSVAALVLSCLTLLPQGARAQDTNLTMTIPQARQMAVASLAQGRPDIALKIALGLVKRDPEDPFAYFILTDAERALRHPKLARRASELAFKYSKRDADKFQAAQMAAQLAVQANQPTRAQIWLRRSANYAPSAEHLDVIKRDYAILRRINPWQAKLRFTLSPSSNLNNGSDSPYNIIDGVPLVGILGGSARALSGTKATADLQFSYRLHQSRKTETRLGGRLYVQRVWLSPQARALAPAAQNSDFGSTTGEISLNHAIAAADGKGVTRLGLALGQSWYGAQHNYDFARADLSYNRKFGASTSSYIATSFEKRRAATGPANDARLYTIKAGISHRLNTSDTLAFNLAYTQNQSDQINAPYRYTTAYATYALGRPVIGTKLSFLAGASLLDYPAYSVGFIAVPGGRQDKSAFLGATMVVQNIQFAGFSPQISLRAVRTHSNVSRFTNTEYSLAVGIASNF
ncbi:surface lipoprotein assembly modifier [Aquicoccus sp. G2-2]|uniref:surface lipoprotein assembly modifier n=1 Tax=Aquicoccus sp. G2-2 TaxID=3092120 RepID=UPI002ADF0F33|nr:surface lipoprotein assembly modifier [Aquicoccus sp. G2-2]MEA1112692.1 surface lipoprotein assembly modifier [Aquicoccus sp. G2-2]